MKYDTLLFDLDGTLTDPFEGITNAIIYALGRLGIEESDRNKLTSFIGPPLTESFSEFYGMSKDDSLRAVSLYREYYGAKGLYENKLYPQMAETLRALRQEGYRLIVATCKPEVFAVKIVERFEIAQYFDYVAGATLDGTRTEKADVIRYALENCAVVDVSRAIMIGDRKHDILGARAVGLKSVGVLYGYGTREELNAAGADAIISAPDQISAAIRQLEKI